MRIRNQSIEDHNSLESNISQNIKEVQRLSGQIATINRFLSKCGEKSLPFFELLRNPKIFLGTSEWEAAF